MSNAWETTAEDVLIVLNAHGVSLPVSEVDQIHMDLDHDAIEADVLNYDNMDDQIASMLSDIEDHLLGEGVITGEKKFRVEEVADQYANQECPDCGEEIPEGTVEGEECHNCGHVFCFYQPCDDEPGTV